MTTTTTEPSATGGYIRNCFLSPRDGEMLFSAVDGVYVPTLDGYAIIPVEEYYALRGVTTAVGQTTT